MGFLVALHFLTILPPLLRRGPKSLEEVGRSQGYFPLVGVALGLALAGMDELVQLLLPLSVANALLLVVMVLLTGALHLDGFADACDGLFGGADPERRLEIMRDSRLGGYGAVGLVCLFLVKYAGLGAVPMAWRWRGLVLMAAAARWAMVVATAAFPYGRAEGLGKAVKEAAGPAQVTLATVTMLAVALALFQLLGLGVLLAVLVGTWLLGRYILTQIPGLTGDTYGAINEVMEVGVLLLLAAAGGKGLS